MSKPTSLPEVGSIAPLSHSKDKQGRTQKREGLLNVSKDDFVIIDGLRIVKPYWFDFISHVKQRWCGRRLLDHFCTEFPTLSREYYDWAIKTGRVRIEGLVVGENHVLKDSQRIRHLVHRHEPACGEGDVEVHHVCPDYVVVSKPAGMPVHPAGQHHKNTVLGVLQATRPDLGELSPLHRLDKPVSGLLVLARNSDAARKLTQQITDKEVRKTYVARVLGRFPEGGTHVVDCPLSWDAAAGTAHCYPREEQPHSRLAPELVHVDRGDVAAGAGGGEGAKRGRDRGGGDPALIPREAVTEFALLCVEDQKAEVTSLVVCRPLTGRTHQIRAHLGLMGHPIANDFIYGGTQSTPLGHYVAMARKRRAEQSGTGPASSEAPGGSLDGAAGSEQASKRPRHSETPGDGGAASSWGDRSVFGDEDLLEDEWRNYPGVMGLRVPDDEVATRCANCPRYPIRGFPLSSEALWLHALRFKGDGWEYSVPPPAWANGVQVPD